MVCEFRMSGILPAFVVLLISLRASGADTENDPILPVASGDDTENDPILPIGFVGRFGEGGVEKEMWVPRGGHTLVQCRISRLQTILETQPGASITWLKDDLPLDNKRFVITPEGHLNITKLVRRRGRASPESDDGVYRCLLVLKIGAKFVVSSPPVILHVAELGRHVSVTSSNVSSIVGAALRLSCRVSSQPPALIQWQNSGGDLPQNVRFTQPTSGVLQITNLEKSDAGIYRCLATNELLNKTRTSEDVLVSVRDAPAAAPFLPPSFLFPAAPITLSVIEFDVITLECLATGLPLPKLTWKRKVLFVRVEEDSWEDVEDLPGKMTLSGQGNLRLEDASLEDAGMYSCIAASKDLSTGNVVSVSQEIRLVVITPPDIYNLPQNVSTIPAKTNRINCSYRDPSYIPVSSPYFPAPDAVWFKDGLRLQTSSMISLVEDNQLLFVNSISNDTGVYQCLITNGAGYV